MSFIIKRGKVMGQNCNTFEQGTLPVGSKAVEYQIAAKEHSTAHSCYAISWKYECKGLLSHRAQGRRVRKRNSFVNITI